MKSIKCFIKINLLLLFILAWLSSSIRIQIKLEADLSSNPQSEKEAESKAKIKEIPVNSSNKTLTNYLSAIPIPNKNNKTEKTKDESLISNNGKTDKFKSNKKVNNSDTEFDPDFISEPRKAKNNTDIKQHKNTPSKSNSYFDPDMIEEANHNEKPIKNNIKINGNKTFADFDPDKIDDTNLNNKKNISNIRPNKTFADFDPDKIDDTNLNIKKNKSNIKPNKTSTNFDPDKIEDPNLNKKQNKSNVKPNKTSANFDPDKIEDFTIKNNNSTKTGNTSNAKPSASSTKDNSTKQSKPNDDKDIKNKNFDPDLISDSKKSPKTNQQPKKPVKSNASDNFDPDKIIETKDYVKNNTNIKTTSDKNSNKIKTIVTPNGAQSSGFDPDKISTDVKININLNPINNNLSSDVKNIGVKNFDPDAIDELKKNEKPKDSKEKQMDPDKVTDLKPKDIKPTITKPQDSNNNDNPDYNNKNPDIKENNNKNDNGEIKQKDEGDIYYLPNISYGSGSNAAGKSPFPCAGCLTSDGTPNNIVLPELPGVKFNSVIYIRKSSSESKGVTELQEMNASNNRVYKSIFNKYYETPKFNNKIIEKFPAPITKPANVNFNWKPSNSLDSNLWQNEDYNRYNNRLLQTSTFNTPQYFTSSDGTNIIHGPSDSGMQIISPARSTVTSYSNQFLVLGETNFLYDAAADKDQIKLGNMEKEVYYDKFLGRD